MVELYCRDPVLALEVINGILEDGDQAELPIAQSRCRGWGSAHDPSPAMHLPGMHGRGNGMDAPPP